MKKSLQIIGILLGSILLAIVIFMLVVSLVYKDEVMHFVTNKIGEQVNAEIAIQDVDISFFGNFPLISIELKDVLVKSTDSFKREEFNVSSIDTALYAKKVLLSFDVMDFLSKNYVIQQIVVHDSRVNYFRDKESNHNWNFTIDSDSTESNAFVELSKIKFYNTLLKYEDLGSKIIAEEYFDDMELFGQFSDENIIALKASFVNNKLRYDGQDYFMGSVFSLDGTVASDSTKYSFQNIEFKTPLGTIDGNGYIDLVENGDLDVDFKGNVHTQLFKFRMFFSEEIAKTLSGINLQTDIHLDVDLKGKFTDKSMPSLNCKINTTSGSLILQHDRYAFSSSGTLQTSDVSNIKKYSYKASSIKLQSGTSVLQLSDFSIPSFDHLKYSTHGSFNINVKDVGLLRNIYDYESSGTLKGSFSTEGCLSDIDDFTKDFFSKNPITANIQCSNVHISAPKDSPYNFSDVSGSISISNSDVVIDSISGNLQHYPFQIQGTASDLIRYLYFDDVDCQCKMTGAIESIDLLPFYEHYEKYIAESDATGCLLGTLNCEAQKVVYDPFSIMNLKTNIILTKNSVELKEISATTMQGIISSGKFLMTDLPNAQTKYVVAGKVSKMSAKDIFSTFNNFDQDMITDKQINGMLSGDFDVSAVMDSNDKILYSTIDALADITIENGNIKNVDPLVQIGKKIKMEEEFTNVSFSSITNTLRLSKDTLYIPDMRINTNAFEMSFAGKHNITKNSFSYYVTLFLKKTLSAKYSSKNKEFEDFGEIEKNHDGNLKIPIKIIGNPDNFDISYDFKKSAKNVKTGLENQKSDWKEIISNKENFDSESPKEEEHIESGFEIEYD